MENTSSSEQVPASAACFSIAPTSHRRPSVQAIAFAGGANAAPVNIESHAGKSITGGSDDKAVVGASLPARLATQGVGRLRTGSRDRGFVPQPSHVGERARRWRR